MRVNTSVLDWDFDSEIADLGRAGLPLAEAKKLGAVFAYGSFFTVALNFLILAFIIFLMVRQMNRLLARQAAAPAPVAPAPTPEDIVLLREIRDSLKNKA